MPRIQDGGKLTDEIKELAMHHGAALVGVASVERFDPRPPLHDAPPRGHHPRDYVAGARAVISIAQPILDPVMDAPARLGERELEMIPEHARRPYMEVLYNRVGHVVQDYMLEFIGQIIGQRLQQAGYRAMIFPTTGLHPRVEGMSDKETWEGHSPFNYTFGPFSHRHAATRAGLGEFGYNNVVLTPEYGPRQRFNSIITDAPLPADPLIEEPVCLRDECRLCLEACHVHCIAMRDETQETDYRSVEHVDRDAIFIDTPAKTDPMVCRRRREGRPEAPVRGDCIRICPVPHERPDLPERLRRLMERWHSGGASP